MWEEILKSIPVYLSSTLKFILGPLSGYGEKLNIITTIIVTIAGMMTSVVIFTYFGEWMRTKVLDKYFTRKQKTEANRHRFDAFSKKLGLAGIAAFTPLLLTPIGGTILAVSFGSPKSKIILYMLVSATAWSIILTVAVYSFGHKVLPEWIK